MRRYLLVLFALFLCIMINISSANAFSIGKDTRKREMKHVQKVNKQEVKDEYKREKGRMTPSGYMTTEEYELLSAPKDKMKEESPIPKPEKAADVKYLPQPDYKIVRYNDPPGSPEISLGRMFKTRRQQNAQGIVSPDYTMLVYPALYYYPVRDTVSCDLFVIPLDENETALNKILKANIMHRIPTPIMSTEKSIDTMTAFRTLTPVDFSADGTKLLVKEKTGSSHDGIWKTEAIIYDFETKSSYKLNELRDAIIYYWDEYKALSLNDVRWDIFPLGFDENNPERIFADAYAYVRNGAAPIYLGLWSIDINGTQARLAGFDKPDVTVSMNGLKIKENGVVPPNMLKIEEKQAKHEDKLDAKEKKAEEKAKLKEIKVNYKETIKEMNTEFKQDLNDYNMQNRIKGTTSTNDAVERYTELKEIQMQKQAERDAKAKARAEAKEQKRLEKESRKNQQNSSGEPDENI